MITRYICISDTHSFHDYMEYNVLDYIDENKYNVLLHAGDFTQSGSLLDTENFILWLKSLDKIDKKIFIAGNHELTFENKNRTFEDILNGLPDDIIYLEDEFCIVNNTKIYGSPWQPNFFNWAFNLPRLSNELKQKWVKIPNDTDILITHGPSFNVLDMVEHNHLTFNVGCELLSETLKIVKPKIHLFGHIHEAYGIKNDDFYSVNASICNKKYRPINKPFVFEINNNKEVLYVS